MLARQLGPQFWRILCTVGREVTALSRGLVQPLQDPEHQQVQGDSLTLGSEEGKALRIVAYPSNLGVLALRMGQRGPA